MLTLYDEWRAICRWAARAHSDEIDIITIRDVLGPSDRPKIYVTRAHAIAVIFGSYQHVAHGRMAQFFKRDRTTILHDVLAHIGLTWKESRTQRTRERVYEILNRSASDGATLADLLRIEAQEAMIGAVERDRMICERIGREAVASRQISL